MKARKSFSLIVCSCFLVATLFAGQAKAQAELFNTGVFNTDVVEEATFGGIPDCLDYCFIGICIILVCSIYECHLEYVPQVSHNLPDLVVSSYPEPGDISWEEAKGAYGALAETGGALAMGVRGSPVYGGGESDTKEPRRMVDNRDPERDPDLIQKDVAVIGNPFVDEIITEIIHLAVPYICPNDTDGFYPYFLSELDALSWRTNIPELLYPATWIPWARVIGEFPFQQWGKVHPRHGFVIQTNDAKAAAVMKQRSVDIVSRKRQPHVYTAVRDLDPSDENEERWQMIAPELTFECIAFGKDIEFGLGTGNATDGKYGAIYWGKHECCTNSYGVVIGVIPITPICI